MQSKALALLGSAIVLAALAGCGGGGDGSSTGSAASAEKGQPLTQRVEEAKKQAEEAQENAAQAGPGSGKRESQPENGGSGGSGSSTGGAENPPPTQVHHDSGGGTAQFRTPHGDNSIQESGREASASEREVAAAALHAFYDDRAAREWGAACEHLAVNAVAAMEAAAKRAAEAGGRPPLEGCPEVLRAFSSAATHRSLVEAAESIDVGAFRVQGDHGVLLYHGVRGNDYAIEMLREGGSWKVAALVGTPLS